MNTVEVLLKNRAIFVKINGSLHLRIPTESLSIHSWHYDNNYFIEFIYHGAQSVLVEHDNKDIWLAILAGLEKVEW